MDKAEYIIEYEYEYQPAMNELLGSVYLKKVLSNIDFSKLLIKVILLGEKLSLCESVALIAFFIIFLC